MYKLFSLNNDYTLIFTTKYHIFTCPFTHCTVLTAVTIQLMTAKPWFAPMFLLSEIIFLNIFLKY